MFKLNKIRFKWQVEWYLRRNLNSDIRQLANIFEENGYELYLVGGCIRDIFLRKTPKDYDLCTNLLPEKVIELMKRANIQCQLQGEHFGVVAVVLHDVVYEIATFRKDLNNKNDRNTDVQFGVTMHDDVLRRDFTINALFYNINTNKVIDLVGGIKDLWAGLIRAVGHPFLRFEEDNLRKLRAIRFAARLNFEIEDATFKAIVADPSLNVTFERIYNELVVMYNSAHSNEYLTHLLFTSQLMPQIIPGIPFVDMKLRDEMTKSFSTWIAGICRTSPTVIKGILTQRKFPTVICNDVDFLLTYCNKTNENVKTFHPLTFHKQWKSCSLFPEDILLFGNNSKYLKYLVDFRPSNEITKKFQEQGYEGKKLGEVLNQHYKLKYLTAINGR